MVREFKLPDIGEGLSEAEIVSWLVEPGETVTEDQPVAEVETDKAVVEVPSPVDGTVSEILAEDGEMVSVGTVIITFDPEGETSPTAGGTSDGAKSATGDGELADERSTGGRVFAAPTTRRIARELGVDVESVEGSGPGGRVTESDVRAAVESAAEAAAEPESAPSSAEGSAETTSDVGAVPTQSSEGPARDRTLAAPATRNLADEKGIDIDAVQTDRTRDGEAFVTPAEIEAYSETRKPAQAGDAEAVATAKAADREAPAEDERIPYRGVRRTIGEQMERSKYTAPHVTHHDEVDVTELVETRDRLKGRAADRGSSLSYLPFVFKAVVAGLREYPILNSRLDEENEEIVLRGEYNVGIATATDAGLMVPVLKDADRKGLLELADDLNDLVEKARERTISPEEMQGGTFSITNFGAIGGEYATPIINYPETAILGLGAIKEKPRVVESQTAGERENGDADRGDIVPRKVMTISLSIDHRVVDGAEAAKFTNTVIEYLESPELLLLE